MYPADLVLESERQWTAHREALAVRWVKRQEANKVLLEQEGCLLNSDSPDPKWLTDSQHQASEESGTSSYTARHFSQEL